MLYFYIKTKENCPLTFYPVDDCEAKKDYQQNDHEENCPLTMFYE